MLFPSKALEALVEVYHGHLLFAAVSKLGTVSPACIHSEDGTELQLTHRGRAVSKHSPSASLASHPGLFMSIESHPGPLTWESIENEVENNEGLDLMNERL